tara:strand:- start:2010 stop:2306 length:297 start_codon:yes stop_codon:yes gene_type:complete
MEQTNIGDVLMVEYDQLLDRFQNPRDGSYTTKMFQEPYGVETKLMEEAFEVAKASMGGEGRQRQVEELADTFYAATAYMVQNGLTWDMVADEMVSRQK